MAIDELRLSDLRVLEKALETRKCVLVGLLDKSNPQRVSIIAILPDGFSVNDHDLSMSVEIERIDKLLIYVRMIIREKRP